MKSQVKNTLIILITCSSLLISSCCKWCKKNDCSIDVDINNLYTECPVPSKPLFKNMSTQYHIGGQKNLDILINNLYQSMEYNERLINSLKCYQNQSKPVETK